MIITNKLNMPDAFVKAIQNSRHNADKCLSATTLLKGTSVQTSRSYLNKQPCPYGLAHMALRKD